MNKTMTMITKWGLSGACAAVILAVTTGCPEGGSDSPPPPPTTPAVTNVTLAAPVVHDEATGAPNYGGAAVFSSDAAYRYVSLSETNARDATADNSLYLWLRIETDLPANEVAEYEWTIVNWSTNQPNGTFTSNSFDGIVSSTNTLRVTTLTNQVQYKSAPLGALRGDLDALFTEEIQVVALSTNGTMLSGNISLKFHDSAELAERGAETLFGGLTSVDDESASTPGNYSDYYQLEIGDEDESIISVGNYSNKLVLWNTDSNDALQIVTRSIGVLTNTMESDFFVARIDMTNGASGDYILEVTSEGSVGEGDYAVGSLFGTRLIPVPLGFSRDESFDAVVVNTSTLRMELGGTTNAWSHDGFYHNKVLSYGRNTDLPASLPAIVTTVEDPAGVMPPAIRMIRVLNAGGNPAGDDYVVYNQAFAPQCTSIGILASRFTGRFEVYGNDFARLEGSGNLEGIFDPFDNDTNNYPFSIDYIMAQESSRQMPDPAPLSRWNQVVNNGVTVPGDSRPFNSYNQPSINIQGSVVFRARTKGGELHQPAHGVFIRDRGEGSPLRVLFDRTTLVPQPNNLDTLFVEPPSFPRIDMWTPTTASRGVHPPAWLYLLEDETETRAGTTGIYTDPFGSLITGIMNLGQVPEFPWFSVPGTDAIKFDVFPGAPAVTDGSTIVFKANYGVPNPEAPEEIISKTGVFYRDLADESMGVPAGGTNSVVLIANTDTLIPGTSVPFGSTAPPSAAGRDAVFAGFDNEDAPTLGGIYLAPLDEPTPVLTPLVEIGEQVPGERGDAVFNQLGEGVSFDGRFMAFWGAWGTQMKELTLLCPTDGNRDRLAYCRELYPEGFDAMVPVHQGIFVHDTQTDQTVAVAKAPADVDDFVYWNFSGRVPGTGEGDDTGHMARWRSSAFVAVSGLANGTLNDNGFHAVFKARIGQVNNGSHVNTIDGIYLRKGPEPSVIQTIVASGMQGTLLDPEAIDPDTEQVLPVTTMGLERDGFRGNLLALTASMGNEEAGWAGIYTAEVLVPPVFTVCSVCGPGQLLLQATARAEHTYMLQVSSNLVDWEDRTNVVANSEGLIECIENTDGDVPACFYRLR